MDIKRWIKIGLRTLHLLSVAGVGGGVLFGLPDPLWLGYWWLALVSGILMMLIDLLANPIWIAQVRGMVILLKLVLLAFLGLDPQVDKWLLAAVVILSAVISHAPGKLRYYSIYHRAVIQSASDTKG